VLIQVAISLVGFNFNVILIIIGMFIFAIVITGANIGRSFDQLMPHFSPRYLSILRSGYELEAAMHLLI
jgi:hypothetical protein